MPFGANGRDPLCFWKGREIPKDEQPDLWNEPGEKTWRLDDKTSNNPVDGHSVVHAMYIRAHAASCLCLCPICPCVPLSPSQPVAHMEADPEEEYAFEEEEELHEQMSGDFSAALADNPRRTGQPTVQVFDETAARRGRWPASRHWSTGEGEQRIEGRSSASRHPTKPRLNKEKWS
jgi:hypothetical protein